MGEIIATVAEHARTINRRWGFNRLPHLVPIEWGTKFLNQKRKWERACFEFTEHRGTIDIIPVRQHGEAMLRAYAKLEELAAAAGHAPAAPGTWEFELEDGRPIVLVRTRAEKTQVDRKPPAQVWCLEEIGQMIAKFPDLVLTKDSFPEMEIIQLRPSRELVELVDDTLAGIPFMED